MKKPITLIILDGFGINDDDYGNAIKAALTPCLDKLLSSKSKTLISASGLEVGLPEGQMGNSEVGHTNIGAGRVVYQELTRITKSIKDNEFFDNAKLKSAFLSAKQNDTCVHLMGLLSDGGVHSHSSHLYALLEMAKKMEVTKVYIHCFMDGRDVSPTSGKDYITKLQNKLKELSVGTIATIIGRYYALDRDKRFDRVKRAYDAMTKGIGDTSGDANLVIKNSYELGKTDEFITPTVMNDGVSMKSGDSVIFFNFRPDRAREITRAIVDNSFDGFERDVILENINFVCMTSYDASMPNVSVAFPPHNLKNTLGDYLSNKGLTQLRIAETEKYAHVTFFFNGGVEEPYPGEDRALIPSPNVPTYDMKPEMSAFEVCNEAVERINSLKYDLIVLNYANCDMVGHTGDFKAATLAVEAVDVCVSKTVEATLKAGGIALVTADHGNADKMYENNGSPFTAHTTNLVPFIIVGKDVDLKENGKLSDIAPTILDLLSIDKPMEMDGISLIKK